MELANPRSVIRSQLAIRNHDVWIMVGYALLAMVAIAAIYFAAIQPGVTQADLAIATALP